MARNVSVVEDSDGKKIVVINDIRFKGKRRIDWKAVEKYLKQYIGDCYEITQTAEKVYIGSEFPDEFTSSNDTVNLRGTAAKAKANASQGLSELIEVAGNKRFQENYKLKHSLDAKYGWYRYTSHFALPIYDEYGDVKKYNIFRVEMLIRHSSDGKLYLYDIVNIKKRDEQPA